MTTTTTEALTTPEAIPSIGSVFVIRALTSVHDEHRVTRIYHGVCRGYDGEWIWYQEIRPDGSLANAVTGLGVPNFLNDKESV